MFVRIKWNLNKIFIFFVVFTIFFPFSFGNLKIAGITLTLQRILAPIIMVYCIFIKKPTFLSVKKGMIWRWMSFLFVWIITGGLLFISRYVPTKDGIKELISLLYGIMILFFLMNLIEKKEDLRFLFFLIRGFVIFFALFGCAEILTGKHFFNSIYYDEEVMYRNFISKGLIADTKMATGFLYGVNDFASFLGIFSVFLFIRHKTRKDKLINGFTFLFILFIIKRNDANIVLFSVVVGMMTYSFFLLVKSHRKKAFLILTAIFLFLGGIVIGISHWHNALNGKIGVTFLSQNGVLADQISGYYQHQGSLFMRLTIYKDAFLASIHNFFLGYGPASFKIYFSRYQSLSNLVNPHSLVFEILFHYGIIILIVFFVLMGVLFQKNIWLYVRKRRRENLIVITSMVIYLLVSFSPSNFITYIYQWLLIGICCLTLNILKE